MMNGVQKTLFGVLIAGLLGSVMTAVSVNADDHREVNRLVSEGEVLPLAAFTEQVRAAGYDRILEVELESEYGRRMYEIEALNHDGRVNEFYFDAVSGERLRGD